MGQFVIEFGAPMLSPVLQAVMTLIERAEQLDMSLPSGGGVTIPATDHAVEGLSSEFADHRINSVTFRTNTAGVRYGLIVEPQFDGQKLSMWMGTVEITSDEWRGYWSRVLQCKGLFFACIGEEEGVEITDDMLAVDSFPWEKWPLLAAALRSDEHEDWFVRETASASR